MPIIPIWLTHLGDIGRVEPGSALLEYFKEKKVDVKTIFDVLNRYDKYLVGLRVPTCDVPLNRRLSPLTAFFLKAFVLGHLRGMIPKVRTFLDEGRREKVMRWLGFIQGVLWVCGAYTLAELKEHNSPPAGNPENPETPKESA